MPLPDLQQDWPTTINGLHRATPILRALRLLLIEHIPNYLELSLTITPLGLSTGVLPGGGEVILNYVDATMVYQPSNSAAVSIPLSGNSQKSLTEMLVATMRAGELADVMVNANPGKLTEALLEGIAATKHPLAKRPISLDDEIPLVIDTNLAADYAAAVYTIFTGIARFRARLTGYMTPIVVWPDHFDLSTLWFATDRHTESAPHINFGFAPFSSGIPRPYFYAYAWPMVEVYTAPDLEAPARWETDDYTGILVAYDDMVNVDNPELIIESLCLSIYQALLLVLDMSK